MPHLGAPVYGQELPILTLSSVKQGPSILLSIIPLHILATFSSSLLIQILGTHIMFEHSNYTPQKMNTLLVTGKTFMTYI